MPIGNSLNIIKVDKPPKLNIINHIYAYRGENANNVYSFFIKNNGNLYAAGKNNGYQLGVGGGLSVNPAELTIISKIQLSRISCAAAGENASLVQVRNSNIYGSGTNDFRQFCGKNTPARSDFFVKVGDNFEAKSIKSGVGYFLILKTSNNRLEGYGDTTINESGGLTESLNFFSNPLTEDNVTLFDAGYNHFIFLQNGILKSVGRNNSGQLGNNSTNLSRSPVNMTTTNIAGKTVIDVAANKTCSIVLCSDNTVFLCGVMFFNIYGNILVIDNTRFVVPVGVSIRKISAGFDHVLVLCDNGDVYAIGDNFKGQLGIGTTDNNFVSLTKVNISKPVAEISAGYKYSLIYCTDGTFYGFGRYTYALGMLDGLTLNQAITNPTQLIF